MGKEGRRAPRVPHDSVLELYDGKGSLLDGPFTLIEVSDVGASFSTTHAFAKGDKVRGRLRLLAAGVMEISGRVVRIKERYNSNLYALEFDSVKTFPR